jgi:hypothetical protein
MRTKLIVSTIVIVGIAVSLLFVLWDKNSGTTLIEAEAVATKDTSPIHEVLGSSVEGRDIAAYTYGQGARHLVFVGGVHGGYEWNSVYLAYRLMDYLDVNPAVIPKGLMVTVIPSANPDGVFKVIGKEGRFAVQDAPDSVDSTGLGRFNAREVDLNRNFDCKWQSESTWKGKTVSAGSEPFSEPEARAVRDFVLEAKPDAVVFWHSKANAVYASECEDGILPMTLDIMKAYSSASGYQAVEVFDAYEITGDAEGWLASIGVPAITVELKTHEIIEWDKNLAGIKALFEYFSGEAE